jgi:hypothetical protein
MSEKKPVPVTVEPRGRKCPICGKVSYSQGGIHPQCAMVQADEPRRIRLAAERQAVAKTKAETDRSKQNQFEKICPRCKSRVPSRRGVCECGHTFVGQ